MYGNCNKKICLAYLHYSTHCNYNLRESDNFLGPRCWIILSFFSKLRYSCHNFSDHKLQIFLLNRNVHYFVYYFFYHTMLNVVLDPDTYLLSTLPTRNCNKNLVFSKRECPLYLC